MFILDTVIIAVVCVVVFIAILRCIGDLISNGYSSLLSNEGFDINFFIETFGDHVKVIFLTNKYDKVRFVAMDNKRFVIMLEKNQERQMIFSPFYYLDFLDYRNTAYNLIIDDDFCFFRYGDEFVYESKEEVQSV